VLQDRDGVGNRAGADGAAFARGRGFLDDHVHGPVLALADDDIVRVGEADVDLAEGDAADDGGVAAVEAEAVGLEGGEPLAERFLAAASGDGAHVAAGGAELGARHADAPLPPGVGELAEGERCIFALDPLGVEDDHAGAEGEAVPGLVRRGEALGPGAVEVGGGGGREGGEQALIGQAHGAEGLVGPPDIGARLVALGDDPLDEPRGLGRLGVTGEADLDAGFAFEGGNDVAEQVVVAACVKHDLRPFLTGAGGQEGGEREQGGARRGQAADHLDSLAGSAGAAGLALDLDSSVPK
jgi:hypothetical protein